MKSFGIAGLLAIAMYSSSIADTPIAADRILKGGLVVDGTGAPGKVADVAIRAGGSAQADGSTGTAAPAIDAVRTRRGCAS